MAVWLTGVLLYVTVSVVAGDCPAGRYGYRCNYQCHCQQSHCNPTSGCQSTKCSMGWSGPTCQKENIALNKTTSASGVYTSTSRAVDGDTEGNFTGGSCFHSAYIDASITSAWWRVDLGQETVLHDVIIYFRTDVKIRRNGIQIYILDTATPSNWVNCYTVTGNIYGTDIADVLKVTCSGEGRYLVLYTTVNSSGDEIPILDFCEVEIEVCSPGTFGADCENYCHCDGGVCNYVTGVCPSGMCLPGWTTNRCDTVCDAGTYATNCHRICSDRHCQGDNSSCDHVTGECAGGCKAAWRGTDCIETCLNGTEYGSGCVKNCSTRMCQGNSTCPRDTGRCTDGCQAGWKGEDCTTACLQGTEYGSGCLKNCSSRMCQGDTSTCPRDTGRCTDGCQEGWKGEDCTAACIQGTEYGSGCVKTCSSRMCQGNSTCPRDTGRCPGGCQAGWKGEDCTTACLNSTEYGSGCLKNCSSRMCQGDTSACPRDTGQCRDGCQAGWKGEDCTTVCSHGTHGTNCSGKCGQCRDSKTCHHVSGTCPDGCSDGWTDHTCTQMCSIGTHGTNCSVQCGQCRDSRTCHHVNGTCPDGCSDGWTDHTCTQEISKPVYTSAAVIAGTSVTTIAVVVIVIVVVVLLRRRESHRKQSDNHTEINKEDTEETGVNNPVPVLGEDEDDVGEDLDATYYNIARTPAVTLVSVDQLGERIKELQEPVGGFQAEYLKLSTTFTRPYSDSQLEENKGKNKYISYYPYDATRVVLKELPDQPGSDYINASYIDGYSHPKAYIAAQGRSARGYNEAAPNRMTLTDFWRMIWEQNCTRIVMLTNLKELGRVKCEAYWSDTSDMDIGNFIVSVTDSSFRANWVVRELQVTDRQTNTRRSFYQFHFTTWPDHGTPEEMALTEFLWLVRSSTSTQDEHLLVHCSAGVGRTGTYIALDYLLDQARAEDAVDVFDCVSRMRDQRKGMIQTKEQYTCLYTALHETLQFGNTAIVAEEFKNNRNVNGTFPTGRMSIIKFIETLNTRRKEQSKETSVKGQVWINGSSDILAFRLRSYLSVNGYLLSEAPSVTTASLFWKLTEEQESSTVIVLPDSHQSLSSFVPSPGDSLELEPVTVRCSTEIPVNTDITLLNIHRQIETFQPTHVRVYILNVSPAESPSTFLELLDELARQSGDVNTNTVTVMYGDGGRQNGAMFCILRNIVQGLKYDKRAEIYNSMRAMVNCLDQDITQDDVVLCYDMVAAYLESQSIYANM